MKTQNAEVGNQKSETEQPFGINYKWVGQRDQIHLGRSVGSGRDRAHAERRFFNQHKHVMADEAGGTTLGVLQQVFLIPFMLMVVAVLGKTRSELHTANERIDHLQFEVRTLTHTVGEVRAEYRGWWSNDNGGFFPTNIILNSVMEGAGQ